MKALPTFILMNLLVLFALVAPVRGEGGRTSLSADSVSNGFFALEGVQAEALSDQEMDAIRGGAITFTLTPSLALPPTVPGVNLNLTAPATGLDNVQNQPVSDHIILINLCGNCFIIPG